MGFNVSLFSLHYLPPASHHPTAFITKTQWWNYKLLPTISKSRATSEFVIFMLQNEERESQLATQVIESNSHSFADFF